MNMYQVEIVPTALAVSMASVYGNTIHTSGIRFSYIDYQTVNFSSEVDYNKFIFKRALDNFLKGGYTRTKITDGKFL
jgi:hypothetical protein